jgi:hypothetical protein
MYFMVTCFSFHELLIFFSQLGCALAQVVSCQPVIVEVWFLLLVSPCGIYGGQSGTGTGFSLQELQFSPVIVIPPKICTCSFISY